jgi:hypothetical protein
MGSWNFSSPDFPGAGNSDYASTVGAPEDSPYVTGPAIGGMSDTTGTGVMHVNTGANPGGQAEGRMQHWSNALDWRHGPLFWLMLMTILYLGLISVQVNYRIGR